MPENLLYYGDNLDILRNHIADESVDLAYLDPPFNSNATYDPPAPTSASQAPTAATRASLGNTCNAGDQDARQETLGSLSR